MELGLLFCEAKFESNDKFGSLSRPTALGFRLDPSRWLEWGGKATCRYAVEPRRKRTKTKLAIGTFRSTAVTTPGA